MLRVTLYTKPGCGLCDEALELLEALAAEVPHQVNEVNIVEDATLFDALWDKIPVMEVGASRIGAPLDEEEVLAFLRAAQSEAGQRRRGHG